MQHLSLSCKKVVTKIKHIIVGTYNNIFNKNQQIAKPREEICKMCSHRENLMGIGTICNICGCVIESKTTVKDEHCPIDKW